MRGGAREERERSERSEEAAKLCRTELLLLFQTLMMTTMMKGRLNTQMKMTEKRFMMPNERDRPHKPFYE